eukprot:1137983-Pelagomonas_calceolata.AAC.1
MVCGLSCQNEHDHLDELLYQRPASCSKQFLDAGKLQCPCQSTDTFLGLTDSTHCPHSLPPLPVQGLPSHTTTTGTLLGILTPHRSGNIVRHPLHLPLSMAWGPGQTSSLLIGQGTLSGILLTHLYQWPGNLVRHSWIAHVAHKEAARSIGCPPHCHHNAYRQTCARVCVCVCETMGLQEIAHMPICASACVRDETSRENAEVSLKFRDAGSTTDLCPDT